jgi:predicted SAM-dependent methyltransferase
MGKVFGVNIVIGIPSFGMVSTAFAQALKGQQFPLVSSAVERYVLNKPIAEARNEIVEFALEQGANYIYWLDDDVIAPPDAFLKMYMHQKDIVNGVYWSKSNPPMPLLFRNHLEGPYLDWHVGDFIEIDAAGNGLTLVKTDVYRKISETVGGPWYSTEYSSFKGIDRSAANNTEDLYFYWKARKAGFKVWADTSIQAYHYEKNSQIFYAMPPNAPQAHPEWTIKPQGKLLIADIGSGPVSPYFEEGKVVSFDIREEVKPDVVCDVRRIPVPDETFDMVHSSHTLEHFGWTHSAEVLKEWCRILKVGGELRLAVPNLRHVAQRLLDDNLHITDFWVLYGEQDYPKNFHAAGFTPKLLKALVESIGGFEDIEVREGSVGETNTPDSWNLQLKAKKVAHKKVDNITPDYIESPPPNELMWPMRLFQQYNERPMDEEEIKKDKYKWITGEEEPPKEAKKPKREPKPVVKPIEKEITELEVQG